MGETLDVLVVDNDDAFLGVASHLLVLAGFTVGTAANGFEAIERLKENAYRAVLTDLTMPKLGGLGLLDWVRSTPDLKDIPVIVLTSYPDEATVAGIRNRGANGCLPKPLNPTAIVKTIADFVTPGNS